RDFHVTGVQTCALPISSCPPHAHHVAGVVTYTPEHAVATVTWSQSGSGVPALCWSVPVLRRERYSVYGRWTRWSVVAAVIAAWSGPGSGRVSASPITTTSYPPSSAILTILLRHAARQNGVWSVSTSTMSASGIRSR